MPSVPVDPAWDGWRQRLGADPIDEVAGMELLDFGGIDTAPLVPCETIEQAFVSAKKVGYPVALKVLGLDHKTEAGGLRLNLIDDGALAQAWSELTELRLPLALQKMTEPGVEVALGLINDPQVGPVVMIAAGGVAIELLDDKALAVPPVSLEAADRLLARMRINRLLTGFRGETPLARDRLLETIAAFSNLASQVGDSVNSIDVNPLIVTTDRVVAVDVYVI